MTRIAVHFIPAEFATGQCLYIQRREAPFAILIDGNAAPEAGYKSPHSPNEAIICDGGEGGIIATRFLVGLYDYEMNNPRAAPTLLNMKPR